MKPLNVIVYEPGKEPRVESHSLDELEEIVDDKWAFVHLPERMVIVCDEAGFPKRLPPNRFGIVGTFFIAAWRRDRIAGLTDDQITAVQTKLREVPKKKNPVRTTGFF